MFKLVKRRYKKGVMLKLENKMGEDNIIYSFVPEKEFTKSEFKDYKRNRYLVNEETHNFGNCKTKYFKYGNYIFEENKLLIYDGRVQYETYHVMTLKKYIDTNYYLKDNNSNINFNMFMFNLYGEEE